jgi:hypothetical protein
LAVNDPGEPKTPSDGEEAPAGPGLPLLAPRARKLVPSAVLRGALIVAVATFAAAIVGALLSIDRPGDAAGILIVFFAVVIAVGWLVAGWAPADPLQNAALAGSLGYVAANLIGIALSVVRGAEVTVDDFAGAIYYALLAGLAALGGAIARARRMRREEQERWRGERS